MFVLLSVLAVPIQPHGFPRSNRRRHHHTTRMRSSHLIRERTPRVGVLCVCVPVLKLRRLFESAGASAPRVCVCVCARIACGRRSRSVSVPNDTLRTAVARSAITHILHTRSFAHTHTHTRVQWNTNQIWCVVCASVWLYVAYLS